MPVASREYDSSVCTPLDFKLRMYCVTFSLSPSSAPRKPSRRAAMPCWFERLWHTHGRVPSGGYPNGCSRTRVAFALLRSTPWNPPNLASMPSLSSRRRLTSSLGCAVLVRSGSGFMLKAAKSGLVAALDGTGGNFFLLMLFPNAPSIVALTPDLSFCPAVNPSDSSSSICAHVLGSEFANFSSSSRLNRLILSATVAKTSDLMNIFAACMTAGAIGSAESIPSMISSSMIGHR
mmetsp:Transcript_42217/g.112686  ORF Transcript_42217/g.112686 Transcript_42217/m.112686 type:complete len:234 (-) Transcript_42217:247-948(-)